MMLKGDDILKNCRFLTHNRDIIGVVDILIDEYTKCLLHRESNEIVQTEFSVLSLLEAEQIEKKRKNNIEKWNFNWLTPYNKGYTIYALRLKDCSEIQGLIAVKVIKEDSAVHIDIAETAPHNLGSSGKFKGVGGHLFAIAIKHCLEAGYDGFIYFIAKTKLIEHYKTKLYAKQIGNTQNMYIDERNAMLLYGTYFKGGEDNVKN